MTLWVDVGMGCLFGAGRMKKLAGRGTVGESAEDGGWLSKKPGRGWVEASGKKWKTTRGGSY